MEKRFLAPKEIANAMVNVGVGKANLPVGSMFLLGILAGAFIGFGGLGNTIASQTFAGIDPGVATYWGSSLPCWTYVSCYMWGRVIYRK